MQPVVFPLSYTNEAEDASEADEYEGDALQQRQVEHVTDDGI